MLETPAAARPDRPAILLALYDRFDGAETVFASSIPASLRTEESLPAYAVIARDSKGILRVRERGEDRDDERASKILSALLTVAAGPFSHAPDYPDAAPPWVLTSPDVRLTPHDLSDIERALFPSASMLVLVLEGDEVDFVRTALELTEPEWLFVHPLPRPGQARNVAAFPYGL